MRTNTIQSPPRFRLTRPSEHAARPIRPAAPDEVERAVSLLTLAFTADPLARWIFPRAESYSRFFPELVRAFAGRAFEAGTVHVLDDLRGVALWLGPGADPDEARILEIVARRVARELQPKVLRLFDALDACRPKEPHWNLPLIGVDPAHQGEGLGSVLLHHALAECDRGQRLAYLEATNPESISLYERHGFEVLCEVQVGSSPPVAPMLREPRIRRRSAFRRF